MKRFDALRTITDHLEDESVICNIGHPSQELYKLADRDKNFYMLGSMGLASSIGLGLALSTEERVVVIEGDGAVLMNLGTLTTIGVNQPENLVLVVIDNEAYGSTGFQDTFTGKGIELDQIAKKTKFRHVFRVDNERSLGDRFREIRNLNGPIFLHVKTKKGKPDDLEVIPLSAVQIRDRFIEAVKSSDH